MVKTILEVKNITKKFPGVIALDRVNFNLRQNEIHSIIGENGAGKSSLCKILTGVYQTDEGEIIVSGNKIKINNPSDAIKLGIQMVYQERNLISFMTGAQNICLGKEKTYNKILINEKQVYRDAYDLSNRLGVKESLDRPVSELGAGSQQIIEILRAFNGDPKILILDEPTSSLGEGEVEPFLNFIKKIKKEMGISVIFISHKLEEVLEISDRVSVFTDGKNVLEDNVKNLTKDKCLKAMLRKKIDQSVAVKHRPNNNDILLKVGKCHYDGREHILNFHACKGEVVGLYGLVGSGRTEFIESLYGLRELKKREIVFNNENIISNITPRKMIERGLVVTPEEKIHAIFPNYSLVKNIGNLFLDKFVTKYGILSSLRETKFTKKVLTKYNVKYSNEDQDIDNLSGGNKQKIIIGRSLEVENIKALIMDEPTKGLDMGAKHEIYRMIRGLVENQNKCIIFISSELPELLSACDRIYVFNEGNIVKGFKRSEFDKKEILKYAFRREVE